MPKEERVVEEPCVIVPSTAELAASNVPRLAREAGQGAVGGSRSETAGRRHPCARMTATGPGLPAPNLWWLSFTLGPSPTRSHARIAILGSNDVNIDLITRFRPRLRFSSYLWTMHIFLALLHYACGKSKSEISSPLITVSRNRCQSDCVRILMPSYAAANRSKSNRDHHERTGAPPRPVASPT